MKLIDLSLAVDRKSYEVNKVNTSTKEIIKIGN